MRMTFGRNILFFFWNHTQHRCRKIDAFFDDNFFFFVFLANHYVDGSSPQYYASKKICLFCIFFIFMYYVKKIKLPHSILFFRWSNQIMKKIMKTNLGRKGLPKKKFLETRVLKEMVGVSVSVNLSICLFVHMQVW